MSFKAEIAKVVCSPQCPLLTLPESFWEQRRRPGITPFDCAREIADMLFEVKEPPDPEAQFTQVADAINSLNLDVVTLPDGVTPGSAPPEAVGYFEYPNNDEPLFRMDGEAIASETQPGAFSVAEVATLACLRQVVGERCQPHLDAIA